MSAKSTYRGHAIIQNEEYKEWVYEDTKELVSKNINRKCAYCEKDPTEDEHDYCIRNLIGVQNACCGHGDENICYVQFLDGNSIHGKEAKVIIEILKKYRKTT